MSRLAIWNLALGFAIIGLAAAAGAFLSMDMTRAYLYDPTQLHTWKLDLMKSAHGHTNLFGILHIALGLSLPYSPLQEKWKKLQTAGLFCGVLAMGPGMLIRAHNGPSDSFDFIGTMIGLCLSAALLSLFSHAAALFYRIMRRM